jgi:hypothetical protein
MMVAVLGIPARASSSMDCGADLTECAKAALKAIKFDEGGLYGLKLITGGKALNRCNLATVQCDGESQAGDDAFARRPEPCTRHTDHGRNSFLSRSSADAPAAERAG